jgi:hypothetical protein
MSFSSLLSRAELSRAFSARSQISLNPGAMPQAGVGSASSAKEMRKEGG